MPAGSRALKLVPEDAQPDYDWLVLVVDPATLAIRGLVDGRRQGGTSSFSFTNLKENVGLADKEFAFKIPRGVDVVTHPLAPESPRDGPARAALRWSLVCLFAGGCAASSALRRGRDAERRQDYDLAVVEYTKALRLRPDDADARLGARAREAARLRRITSTRGRRLAADRQVRSGAGRVRARRPS